MASGVSRFSCLARRRFSRYSLGLGLRSKILLTLKENKVVQFFFLFFFFPFKDFQQSVTVVLLQDEHTLISAGAVDG